LAESEPENTLFLPFQSEAPTVTIVRIKGFMSGILNTVLELTEGLGGSRFIEDNLLYQLHQKLGDAKVAMYGDMGWTE